MQTLAPAATAPGGAWHYKRLALGMVPPAKGTARLGESLFETGVRDRAALAILRNIEAVDPTDKQPRARSRQWLLMQ